MAAPLLGPLRIFNHATPMKSTIRKLVRVQVESIAKLSIVNLDWISDYANALVQPLLEWEKALYFEDGVRLIGAQVIKPLFVRPSVSQCHALLRTRACARAEQRSSLQLLDSFSAPGSLEGA